MLKIKFRDENGNVKTFEVLELDLSCPSSSTPQPTGSNPQPTGSNPQPTGSNPQPTGSNPQPTGSFSPITGTLPTGLRHVYSQLQPWSFDGQHYLAIDILNGDEAVVLDASSLQEKVRITNGYGHRWLPQTNKVFYLDDNISPAKIKLYDVLSLTEETFNLPYAGIRAARCWEEISRDGQWTAVYVDNPEPRVLTYNLFEKQVYVDKTINELGIGFEPDWVGISPDGNYLAIQWVSDGSGKGRGLQLYDIRTGENIRQIHSHHNHGDFGLDENGNAYYVSVELQHPNDNNNPGVILYPLDGSPKQALGTSIPWGRAEHLSAQGKEGSPVIITAGEQFNDDFLKGNIWLQHLNGERRNIIKHHSNINAGYYAQPQAVMSLNGRFVAFATNNGGTLQDVKDVIVSISSSVSQPTGSNPQPTGSTPQPTGSNPPPVSSSNGRELGQNLHDLKYWSTSNAFLNLMDMCGSVGVDAPWLSSNFNDYSWDDGQPVDVDNNGYVRSLAQNQFVRTLFPSGLGGEMVVSWEGEGHLQINGVGQNAVDGRFEVSLPANAQTELLILSVNPNNYPENIRIVPKSLENSNETFHPEFIKQLSGYKTIRFMNWMDTNSSPLSKWNDRKQPTYISQGHGKGVGVAIEKQIELCNELGADMWFCIPHLATNNFIQKTAELISNSLNSTLKVYVEFSNECWNYGGAFQQTQWCDNEGQRLGLPGSNSYEQGRRFYARKTRETMEIFENVFGNETSTRLVRVIGGQNAGSGVWAMENLMLPFENTYEHIDAIAIAPYFGYQYDNALTEQEILNLSPQEIDATLNQAKQMKNVADNFGKKLVAYEGGQHWVPAPHLHNDANTVSAMINANNNPQMEQLYKTYLNKWFSEVSLGLFVHYNFISFYSSWGAWGTAENINQTDTPKMRALKSFLSSSS